jgi:hypothetical protein
MYTRQISYASTLPISLTEAKNFLKVDSDVTDDDALITLLIQSVVQHVENVTGQSLASKNYILFLDRFPGFPYLDSAYTPLFGALPFYFGFFAQPSFPPSATLAGTGQLPFIIPVDKTPVTAVSQIIYIDASGTSQTLLPGRDFVVDLGSEPARIGPLPGGRWPLGMVGLSVVQVYFTAGYTATVDTDSADVTITGAPNPPEQTTEFKFVTSIPADLKLAMLLLISDAYANREPNVAGAVGRIPTLDAILAANTHWDFSHNNL